MIRLKLVLDTSTTALAHSSPLPLSSGTPARMLQVNGDWHAGLQRVQGLLRPVLTKVHSAVHRFREHGSSSYFLRGGTDACRR